MSSTIKGFFNASISGITFGLIPPVRRSRACHRYAFHVRFDLSLRFWLPRYVRYAYVSSHQNVACFWRFLAHIVPFFCVRCIVYRPYRGL